MKIYPESLLDKLFSSLSISGSLTHEVIVAMQGRINLFYGYNTILPYFIAGIAIVTLIVLYKKWKTPTSLRLFSGILLLGGFIVWVFLLGVVEEIFRLLKIKNFYVDNLSLVGHVPSAYIPLLVPLIAFPLVIYFLSRYAYACKGKVARLVYASVGLQILISCAASFWEMTSLAKFRDDDINRAYYIEIKPYTAMHILSAILLYGSLVILLYLLWSSLRKVARSNGALVAEFYMRLLKLVTFFLVSWIVIASYVNVHQVKDIVPLWTRYVELIGPHLFYAVFAIYFMYALYRIRSIE